MKPTMRRMVATALLATAVMVGGCGSSGGPAPAELEGSWILESFGGVDMPTPANPSVTSELILKDGAATGSGGVNSFSGSYEASGDGTISFGEIASTLMAGEPAAMEQETEFFAALKAAENFELNDGKLVLSDKGNNTLMILAAQ